MEYLFESLDDTSCLHDFKCGVAPMDCFIQDGLNLSITNHYCNAYLVWENAEESMAMAVFALSFDSLDLDVDDKDEMMSGVSCTDIPKLTDNYREIFLNKSHYPALEIAYLAVSEECHFKGLGRIIVEAIAQKAQMQDLAGCQFLTVEALNAVGNNAVGFYEKCGFSSCEYPNPNKGTLRMFRTLYPISVEDKI